MIKKLVQLKWMMRIFLLAFVVAIIGFVSTANYRIAFASYGPDVTVSSAYIESGHYVSYVGSRAFDNYVGSTYMWISSEQGASVNNTSYIGQDFGGSVREIRRVGIVQLGSVSTSVSSYSLQFSDDCASWASAGTASIANNSWSEQYTNFDAAGTHRCWRLLAGSATGSDSWYVVEIEMFEYTEDPTPTVTVTPTITPTPTNTPLPISYESTLSSGLAYEIERSATFGEIALFAIMAFISVIWLIMLFVRISSNANTNS